MQLAFLSFLYPTNYYNVQGLDIKILIIHTALSTYIE